VSPAAGRTPSASVRVVYADLDGTLTGPGASLFAGATGVTEEPVRAIAALHRAGVALVPVSGRTLTQALEAARLLGARDVIAELGGLTAYDLGREVVRAWGRFAGPGTPFEAMARSGAGALLLERFDLEPHAPWAFAGRECTMLLRGRVDVDRARRALEEARHDWLDLVDNGVIGVEDGNEIHAYHLLPLGVGKAQAIAADLARRGLGSEAAVVVGDSPADVAAAPHVATAFVVANGREAARGAPDNVVVTESSYGDGFAEAVLSILEG
jgi:hydroxymethylpyrimidine pyrophosphatase-like HAD family hydrolase